VLPPPPPVVAPEPARAAVIADASPAAAAPGNDGRASGAPADAAPADAAPADDGRDSGAPVERRVLFHRRSPVQDVYVVEENGQRVLRFGAVDGNDQSALDPAHPDRLAFEYVRLATLGTLLRPASSLASPRAPSPSSSSPSSPSSLSPSSSLSLAVPPRRALVVGLGGGAFPSWLVRHDPTVRVDVAELDPVVVDVARDFFSLPVSPRLAVHVADGAVFMARARAGYDVVLLDAFSGDGIPPALSSSRFFADTRRVLADDGIVMMNVALVSRDDTSEITRRFANAFPGCVVVRGRREDNVVLFGARRPLSTTQLHRVASLSLTTVGLDVLDDVGAVRTCP
jgi:spermidine synthase